MSTRADLRKPSPAIPLAARLRYTPTQRRHIEAGYESLGISPNDVERLPQVTPQFKAILPHICELAGDPPDLMLILSLSEDPDAIKFRDAYERTPHESRGLLPIEAYCAGAGISPSRVLDITVSVCMRFGVQSSALIAAMASPSVVRATIYNAVSYPGAEGFGDRMAIHKATGFVPSPKGNSTTVNVQQNAHGGSQPQQFVTAPSPENTIRRLAEKFNESRARLPAAIDVPALEAHEED